VALASDARKGTPFGVDKRHITFGSETAKEVQYARVGAPHLSFVPFPARITGRQRLCLHLKINFGVDVGSVDGNMSEPRTNGVDVDPARRRCVAVVWRIVCGLTRFFARDGTLSLACFACLSTSVWIPKRVTGAP